MLVKLFPEISGVFTHPKTPPIVKAVWALYGPQLLNFPAQAAQLSWARPAGHD